MHTMLHGTAVLLKLWETTVHFKSACSSDGLNTHDKPVMSLVGPYLLLLRDVLKDELV